MTATRYFDEQVLPRRPYLTERRCRAVLAAPIERVVQPDGRIRYRADQSRILRVITLADGVTLHNAFLDRGFRRSE